MSEDDDTPETNASNKRVSWRRIGRIIGLVALLIIVIPFVIYAVPQVVGAEQSYVVLSGSMEPAISAGDVIVVNSVGAAAIQEGDVITFTQGDGGRPTTHRVHEVVEQDGGVAFRTKGDANEDPDHQLATQFEGRVMSVGGYLLVIPYIGYVIQFMQTNVGFVALFVVPISLLIVSELWNIVGTSKSDTEAESVDGGEAKVAEGAGEGAISSSDVSSADVEAQDNLAASTADAAGEAVKTDDKALTFNALELQLGLVSLGAFLVYSLWVAYATIEIFESGIIWASTVAGAVAVAFLLFLGLYINGKRGGDDENIDSPSVEAPAEVNGGTIRRPGDDIAEADMGENSPLADSADPGESFDFKLRPDSPKSGGADAAGIEKRTQGGEANE